METLPEVVINLGPENIEEVTGSEEDAAAGIVTSKIFLIGKVTVDAQIFVTSVTVDMLRSWRFKGDSRVNGKVKNRLFLLVEWPPQKVEAVSTSANRLDKDLVLNKEDDGLPKLPPSVAIEVDECSKPEGKMASANHEFSNLKKEVPLILESVIASGEVAGLEAQIGSDHEVAQSLEAAMAKGLHLVWVSSLNGLTQELSHQSLMRLIFRSAKWKKLSRELDTEDIVPVAEEAESGT